MVSILKNLIFLLALLFFSTTILYSCNFEKPYIEKISNVKVISLKDTILNLELTLDIQNPNLVSAILQEIDSKIFVENRQIGTSSIDREYELAANGKTSITLQTAMYVPNLSVVLPKIFETDSTLITVEGKYMVKKFVFSTEIAEKTELYINLKEQIQKNINETMSGEGGIKIDYIKPTEITPQNVKLEVGLKLVNIYPFSYKLKSLHIICYPEGSDTPLGESDLARAIELLPNSSQTLPLQTTIKNQGILGGIGSIVFGGSRNLVIKGTATVEFIGYTFQIPFEQKQAIIPTSPFGN